MAAESPEPGQSRAFASKEQSSVQPLLVGGFSTVEQHYSGQQPLPGAARSASAGNGPVRHTGGFEL
ncbi:hypothetical protein [Amycolatopsis sp. lyj-108]|uniref:hypothetical protein n=1 Tax=Amycolatopsis sp. lyj-108 TaxID=2789286 RepID=UPI003978EA25